MPRSLQWIQLPGDGGAIDGSVKVIGEWRITGRAHRSLNETLGNAYFSENEGTSAGFRWFRQGWRLDINGNRRQWSYGDRPARARTVSVSAGIPLGPVSANLYAERGEQRRDTIQSPSASYNGSLRWNGSGGSASWSTSYFETLNNPPRLRTDLLGSVRLGNWELAGGRGRHAGCPAAANPASAQIGIPITHDLLLSIGVENAPPIWGALRAVRTTLPARTRSPTTRRSSVRGRLSTRSRRGCYQSPTTRSGRS